MTGNAGAGAPFSARSGAAGNRAGLSLRLARRRLIGAPATLRRQGLLPQTQSAP